MTPLVDVNHPGSQEDVLYNWQPAHSLVEHEVSGTEIAMAPSLLALAVAPAFLPPGQETPKWQPASSPLVFTRAQSLFCEHTKSLCTAGKVVVVVF